MNGSAVAAETAAQRMSDSSPEQQQLMHSAGRWNVVCTIKPTPEASPQVTHGLVAVRRMVGLYLEEIMQPETEGSTPDFRRIAYLTYSQVEGRWQYVSLDTRLPVGIMPAYSFDKGTTQQLTLNFLPMGFVGMGQAVEGRMMRSNLVITRDGVDRETAKQYWITSDGTGREWLAVQYDYTRKH